MLILSRSFYLTNFLNTSKHSTQPTGQCSVFTLTSVSTNVTNVTNEENRAVLSCSFLFQFLRHSEPHWYAFNKIPHDYASFPNILQCNMRQCLMVTRTDKCWALTTSFKAGFCHVIWIRFKVEYTRMSDEIRMTRFVCREHYMQYVYTCKSHYIKRCIIHVCPVCRDMKHGWGLPSHRTKWFKL